jgi:hypothetical protein
MTQAPPLRRVLALAGGLIVLLTLLVGAFTWPQSQLEPRSLPIAVVGDDRTVGAVSTELALTAGQGDFDVHGVADREGAIEAIRDREVYGALVPAEGELLVATAASPTVAQLITQAGGAGSGERPPVVTDVAPPTDDDPRGAVFNSAALPLVLGGIVAGVASTAALTRTRQRIAAAALVAVGAGLALTGMAQGWLGALDGDYLANASVVALGIAAIAFTVVGLGHLLGLPGAALGALLTLLVGNPLSGVTSAPELIPLGWLGQLLPPGAMSTALRGTAFFDGAATATPLLVLATWAAAGLAVALVPKPARREKQAAQPVPV